MITSKNNDLIKQCIKLKQKKYSKQESLCFVESIKIVKQLYSKNLVEVIFAVSDKMPEFDNNYQNVQLISDDIAKYLSDSVTTDGVFAICKIPKINDVIYNRCLILDRIQDPSNLGAIIRSACAFGYSTILSLNSVYPYSFKSIRSSMGYVFDVNFVDISIEELQKIKNDKHLNIFIADMNGQNIDQICFDKNQNTAIIIGNEGQGVDEKLKTLSDKIISISMLNSVESLNASVSAGILMYYFR